MNYEEELKQVQRMLESYQELASDQWEDDAFVARGNGFCDRKYSDDFIEMQIAQLTARAANLKAKIAKP